MTVLKTQSHGALSFIFHSLELNSKDWRVAKPAGNHQVIPAVLKGERNKQENGKNGGGVRDYIRSDHGENLHQSKEAGLGFVVLE